MPKQVHSTYSAATAVTFYSLKYLHLSSFKFLLKLSDLKYLHLSSFKLQVCTNVPQQECHSVPRQKCRNVPTKKCDNVPRQVKRAFLIFIWPILVFCHCQRRFPELLLSHDKTSSKHVLAFTLPAKTARLLLSYNETF